MSSSNLSSTDGRALTPTDIQGSWTLVSVEVIQGMAVIAQPYGEEPSGSLIYTPDGHVSALITGGEPLIAYAGRFALEGDTVIHRVDVGVMPIGPGSTLNREARFDELGRMTLLADVPDMPSATLALTWVRADERPVADGP